MAHHTQKLIIMDLKKLLNESESLKKALSDQHQVEDLNRYFGITQPEDLEKIMNAARSGIPDSAAFTSENAARQAAENALGLGGFPGADFETAAEKMRKEFEQTAGLVSLASSYPMTLTDRFQSDIEKASGMLEREIASDLQGRTYINFEEIEEREKERQQERMMQMGNDHMHHMARQAAQHQRREEAKVEYARRNAEASEAALEAERARTADAKADALLAREEARISRRNMRISLWFAAGSLLVAAWPFIKEAIGL